MSHLFASAQPQLPQFAMGCSTVVMPPGRRAWPRGAAPRAVRCAALAHALERMRATVSKHQILVQLSELQYWLLPGKPAFAGFAC